MLNNVCMMGRIGTDLVLEKPREDLSKLTFRLAVDRDGKDKNTGERTTDWFSVVAWNGCAGFISRNFEKGRMIGLVGRMQSRAYKDQDGNNRTVTELVAKSAYFADSYNGKKEADDGFRPYYLEPGEARFRDDTTLVSVLPDG